MSTTVAFFMAAVIGVDSAALVGVAWALAELRSRVEKLERNSAGKAPQK